MTGMTTTYRIIKRKKATGEPGNGGEFGRDARPEATAVLAPADDIATVDYLEYSTDRIRVELHDIGEGRNGVYDESDPDDEQMLRFTVSVREDDEWEQLDGVSYCTNIAATVGEDEAAGWLEHIALTIDTDDRDEDSMRFAAREQGELSEALTAADLQGLRPTTSMQNVLDIVNGTPTVGAGTPIISMYNSTSSVRAMLEDAGDWLDGERDENNADDHRVLRFSVLAPDHRGKWVPVEGASSRTGLPLNSDRATAAAYLHEVVTRLDISGGEGEELVTHARRAAAEAEGMSATSLVFPVYSTPEAAHLATIVADITPEAYAKIEGDKYVDELAARDGWGSTKWERFNDAVDAQE